MKVISAKLVKFYSSKISANCVADVAFVIDDSGSIRDANIPGQTDNWDSVKNFIIRIVSRLNIGSTGVRIAAVTFSNEGIMKFDLDDYLDKTLVEARIQTLEYNGGNTNTTGGLRVARSQVFTPSRGDRSGVANIMIVITDGKPTVEVNNLWSEVDSIKGQGTSIVGVGVTNSVDESMMQRLVSTPASRYYHQVSDFSDLDTIVDIVTESSCQVIQPITQAPATQVPATRM